MILSRETSISTRGFVGQYVPILNFPRDVADALEARLSRIKLFEPHTLAGESGAKLRARLKEMLGETIEPSATETEVAAVESVDGEKVTLVRFKGYLFAAAFLVGVFLKGHIRLSHSFRPAFLTCQNTIHTRGCGGLKSEQLIT